MTARWSSLPEHLGGTTTRKPKNARLGAGRYVCHACKNVETQWAKAERHADTTKHARIECLPAQQGAA